MRIAPNMEWVRPYLEAVSDIIPLHRIAEVRGYKVPVSRQPQTEASIIVELQSGRAKIFVMLTGHRIKRNGKRGKATYESLLLALAHELAHLKEWEHTSAHFTLTAKILNRFARVARKQKISNTSRPMKGA